MIYKSYLVEKDINLVNKNLILFYGENLGLKNDFKEKIKHSNKEAEIITFTQEEIIKDETPFFNEILNISLFEEEKIYFIDQTSDKILETLQEIENKIDKQKIFLFAELLDKRSKLRNYFEKSKNFVIVPCYADNEITIKKSVDNAMTWSSSLLVHKGKTFGYTCLVTGMLKLGVQKQGGLLYESSNETIAFLRFNVNMSLNKK